MLAAAAAEEWAGLVQKSIDIGGGKLPARLVQLATLTSAGHPTVRTMVFRGWHRGDNPVPALCFHTDTRSQKIEGIAAAPWAEACWYFNESRQQFRFTGTLTVVGPDAKTAELRSAREDMWRDQSDSARLQYRFPHPAERRSEIAEGDDTERGPFQPEPPNAEHPEGTFALLLLQPTAVDHYNSDPFRQRWCADYSATAVRTAGKDAVPMWTKTPINP
jgi:pyridoxamine 5'-phosphate oxidase